MDLFIWVVRVDRQWFKLVSAEMDSFLHHGLYQLTSIPVSKLLRRSPLLS